MNWGQARKLLRLAHRRGGESALPLPESVNGEESPGRATRNGSRASSLCVASGKGGTGKSVITASLAELLALRGPTLVVDGDLGVGNAHILQGVSPDHSFVDVVEGRRGVREIVCSGRSGVDILSGGSGVSRMAGLSAYELHLIGDGIAELEGDYQHLVVDSAAGISEQTISFAAACDAVLVVTTPDLTAMTDAYAFLKVLLGRDPRSRTLLVVNRAESEEEARRAGERILNVSERFLGRAPEWLGSLPEDAAVRDAGNHRLPVVAHDPGAPVSRGLRQLSVRLLECLGGAEPRGMGEALLAASGFSRRYADR